MADFQLPRSPIKSLLNAGPVGRTVEVRPGQTLIIEQLST